MTCARLSGSLGMIHFEQVALDLSTSLGVPTYQQCSAININHMRNYNCVLDQCIADNRNLDHDIYPFDRIGPIVSVCATYIGSMY